MKYATVIKKGVSCHKDYSGVMANASFGGVTIYQHGMTIYIPKHGLTKQGKIKKCWKIRLENMTAEDALWLNKKIAA